MNQDIAESWENPNELQANANIYFLVHSVLIYKYLHF